MESQEDIEVTKRLKECGIIIDIPLLDHVIIGDNSYVSLMKKGVI
ncbi:DNA repair protein RadC (plasmid) [Bacillus toyonensis]|nr:DNA repair protein RadC [Bacillus toyonensis]